MEEAINFLSFFKDIFEKNILLGVILTIFIIWFIFIFQSFKASKDDLRYKRAIKWIKEDTISKRYIYLLELFI